jgi:hypothetical protein
MGGLCVHAPMRLDQREAVADLADHLDNWIDAVVSCDVTRELPCNRSESLSSTCTECSARKDIRENLKRPFGSGCRRSTIALRTSSSGPTVPTLGITKSRQMRDPL